MTLGIKLLEIKLFKPL